MKNGISTTIFEDGFEWVYKNDNPWRSEISTFKYVLLYNNKIGVASLNIYKNVNKAVLIINEDIGLEIPEKEFVYNYKEDSFNLVKLLENAYNKYKKYIEENITYRYLFNHEFEDGETYTCILKNKGMTYSYWGRIGAFDKIPEHDSSLNEMTYIDIVTDDTSKLSNEEGKGESCSDIPIEDDDGTF